MATKKAMWILFGILVISAWFLGPVIQAGAETLKVEVINVVTKIEAVPIENIQGAGLMPMIRDGVFRTESGELGSMKFIGTAYGIQGKGGSFLGYIVYIFGDGSTIVGTLQPGTWGPDPEGKVGGIQKGSGELINGSGRFKGIKGSLTMTGKLLKLTKGEIASKGFNEIILTYTLSP